MRIHATPDRYSLTPLSSPFPTHMSSIPNWYMSQGGKARAPGCCCTSPGARPLLEATAIITASSCIVMASCSPHRVASSAGCDGQSPPALELPLTPPGHKLTVFLYEDVANCESVREALLDGKIPELALVNPDSVASCFHLAVAATTALLNASQGALNVKSLHAELVYCLSPTCNISESFKTFGSGKGDRRVLLAFIDTSADDIAKALAVVQGRPVDPQPILDAPMEGEKEARLRKGFKIGLSESQVESAVITRVAAKKCL